MKNTEKVERYLEEAVKMVFGLEKKDLNPGELFRHYCEVIEIAKMLQLENHREEKV